MSVSPHISRLSCWEKARMASWEFLRCIWPKDRLRKMAKAPCTFSGLHRFQLCPTPNHFKYFGTTPLACRFKKHTSLILIGWGYIYILIQSWTEFSTSQKKHQSFSSFPDFSRYLVWFLDHCMVLVYLKPSPNPLPMAHGWLRQLLGGRAAATGGHVERRRAADLARSTAAAGGGNTGTGCTWDHTTANGGR